MNEIDFKNWLIKNNVPKKVQSDYTSRLKRIERSLQIDLDEQYNNDKCSSLLLVFKAKGVNTDMQRFLPNDLPIGKYHLSAYKLAVNKYIQFLDYVTEER